MPYKSKQKQLKWHSDWEKRNRKHRNAYQNERRKKKQEAYNAQERSRKKTNIDKFKTYFKAWYKKDSAQHPEKYVRQSIIRKARECGLSEEQVNAIKNDSQYIEAKTKELLIKRLEKICKTLQTLEKPSLTR
jgi:hypothetical protein